MPVRTRVQEFGDMTGLASPGGPRGLERNDGNFQQRFPGLVFSCYSGEWFWQGLGRPLGARRSP
eukprot:5172367-Lingulodinium_polyedra.AAC.1